MNTFLSVFVLSLAAAVVVAGCDSGKVLSTQKSPPTYSGCLLSAVASGGELSVEDIRSLCAEATGVTEPAYKHAQNPRVPRDDFTQCSDTQRKELEAKGVAQAARLAKLSCSYPEVE